MRKLSSPMRPPKRELYNKLTRLPGLLEMRLQLFTLLVFTQPLYSALNKLISHSGLLMGGGV